MATATAAALILRSSCLSVPSHLPPRPSLLTTCQVISVKLLVHDERYTNKTDVEGLLEADAINAHLPPAVRVMTVQKVHLYDSKFNAAQLNQLPQPPQPLQSLQQVNKKFNARHICASRIYEYYLPSHMLGELPLPCTWPCLCLAPSPRPPHPRTLAALLTAARTTPHPAVALRAAQRRQRL